MDVITNESAVFDSSSVVARAYPMHEAPVEAEGKLDDGSQKSISASSSSSFAMENDTHLLNHCSEVGLSDSSDASIGGDNETAVETKISQQPSSMAPNEPEQMSCVLPDFNLKSSVVKSNCREESNAVNGNHFDDITLSRREVRTMALSNDEMDQKNDPPISNRDENFEHAVGSSCIHVVALDAAAAVSMAPEALPPHAIPAQEEDIDSSPDSLLQEQSCTTSEDGTLSWQGERQSNTNQENRCESRGSEDLNVGSYSIEIGPSADCESCCSSSSSFSSSEYSLDSQIESAYTEDYDDSTATSTDAEESSLESHCTLGSMCGSHSYVNYWKTKFVYPKTIPSPSASYSVVSLSFLEPKIPTGIASRVYDEAMRILKPGGLLYVVDVDGQTVPKIPKMRQMMSRLTDPGVRHKVHEIQTKQILQTNGFGADGFSNENLKIVRWIGFKPKQQNTPEYCHRSCS